MCVAGVCSPTPDPTVRVAVDSSERYQTLIGFGATVGFVQGEIVQYANKAELYEAMFAGAGTDILRVRNSYGYVDQEDLDSTSEILSAASDSLGRSPTVMLTSWSPPGSLKANGAPLCEGNFDTCTLATLSDGSFDYAGFGSYWRASLDAYASFGVDVDYIGIQNNPDWLPPESAPNEACRFLPTEGTATVSIDETDVEVRYPGFDQALAAVVAELEGLDSPPMIAAPEASGVLAVADYISELDITNVDAISHHMYQTDPTAVDVGSLEALGDLGRQNERPLLQTEMQADGLGTAVLVYYSLAVEGASAYVQNDFVSSASRLTDNPTALIAMNAEDIALQAPYYALRHYALQTDPGWVRVGATSDEADLLASAWLSPEKDALTLVLVNTGLRELALELDPGEGSVTTSEVTRTVFEGVERAAQLGPLPVDSIVRVPGRAMVTVAWRR
jgi:hypothetical protein